MQLLLVRKDLSDVVDCCAYIFLVIKSSVDCCCMYFLVLVLLSCCMEKEREKRFEIEGIFSPLAL